MNTIQLSPSVLDWAASQTRLPLIDFAQKVSKRSAEEIAEGRLTDAQVVKFSKIVHVPMGFLFLEEPPPPRKLPVTDFRTVQFADPLGRDFYETFDDIEIKQSWYREHLQSTGAQSLPFVGRYSLQRPTVRDLAAEMRSTLMFSMADLENLRNADELFTLLSAKYEQAGILVFKNGVVGNNTHRSLSVSEFRGFALADGIAPVVFINGADAQAAWVFTLAHELAHIWLGDSGVSAADPNAENDVERFCNAVAAEFLVPYHNFIEKWNEARDGSNQAKIEHARKSFKVSYLVIARRALELGLIDRQTYRQYYD